MNDFPSLYSNTQFWFLVTREPYLTILISSLVFFPLKKVFWKQKRDHLALNHVSNKENFFDK